MIDTINTVSNKKIRVKFKCLFFLTHLYSTRAFKIKIERGPSGECDQEDQNRGK